MKLSNSCRNSSIPPHPTRSTDVFVDCPPSSSTSFRPSSSHPLEGHRKQCHLSSARDPRPAHRGEITATDTLSSSAASPGAFTHAYVSYLHLRVPSHGDAFLEMPPAGGATTRGTILLSAQIFLMEGNHDCSSLSWFMSWVWAELRCGRTLLFDVFFFNRKNRGGDWSRLTKGGGIKLRYRSYSGNIIFGYFWNAWLSIEIWTKF